MINYLIFKFTYKIILFGQPQCYDVKKFFKIQSWEYILDNFFYNIHLIFNTYTHISAKAVQGVSVVKISQVSTHAVLFI